MATTDAELCNRGLLYIGQRTTIDFLDEASQLAASARAVYTGVLDAALQRFEWSFAKKRDVLALVSGAERDEWEYVYALPSDCLVPRRIAQENRTPRPEEKIPFEVELNDAGTGQV